MENKKIGRASYMLKRLRDCGYKADKIIGATDYKSLSNDLEKLVSKVFVDGRSYTSEEILKTVKTLQTEFLRCMYQCPDYDIRDSRCWTILIDGGRDNIFLTYYKNFKDIDSRYEDLDDYFELYDGGQYVKPLRLRLDTSSVEVIVENLTNLGITKKYSED